MLFDQRSEEREPHTINLSASVAVSIYASPLVRAGLEEMLTSTRFLVSAEQPGIDDTTCDLLIIHDGHHPNGATDLIGELKTWHPSARIVVLADQFDLSAVMSARRAGTDGFCLTTANREVLIHSLELVMLGEPVVPSELILAIMGDGARGAEASPWRRREHPNGAAPPCRALSSREIEILSWLREGAPNKVIARKLNVAEATVKVHIKAILRKIGAGNRTQAAIWATDHLPHATAVQ
jgi:two-component system nitrate/nitrite response regulator NarL